MKVTRIMTGRDYIATLDLLGDVWTWGAYFLDCPRADWFVAGARRALRQFAPALTR